MVIDITTLTLFPFYPRRVGIPSYIVRNVHQFEQYILKHNGTITGCHVGVYNCSSRPLIDKIVFDFDGGKKGERLKDVFEEVKIFVGELISRKFVFIPVFSGNRGFHIYVLLQPIEVEESIARFLLKTVQEEFAEDYKFVDKQKFGVVNAMIRVPNTLNMKRKLWCCYLPLHFVEWSIKELLEYSKTPQYQTYKFNGQKYPLITDLAEITMNEVPKELKPTQNFEYAPPKIPPLHLLKDLVRPCVFEEITSNPEPPHYVRLDFVAELKHLGYTPQQVFEICKQFKWEDFDPRVTLEQIHDIYERDLLPPSCKTLRKFVKCKKCGWHYFWLE